MRCRGKYFVLSEVACINCGKAGNININHVEKCLRGYSVAYVFTLLKQKCLHVPFFLNNIVPSIVTR